jgi:FKBP-type peptidyl-prolyl cis-trans isomerase 2
MKQKFEKKPPTNWKKIGAITIGVLFVVLMVVSSLGMGWLSSFSSIEPGNVVSLDFTIRDDLGRPILTSDQQVYKDAIQRGEIVSSTNPVDIQANVTVEDPVLNILVYVAGYGWTGQYGLFGPEINTISAALVGMKSGGQKTVALPAFPELVQTISRENLEKMNVSVADLRVGDQLQMGVTTFEEGSNQTIPDQYAFRIATITAISSDSVTLDSGYGSVDLHVASFKKQ